MRKITALTTIMMFLMVALTPVSTNNTTAAITNFESVASLDGHTIDTAQNNYSECLVGNGSVFSIYTNGAVGQYMAPGPGPHVTYGVYHTFMTFDTSAIPSISQILSTTLHVKTHSYGDDSVKDFDVIVGGCDYGASLDVTDANINKTLDATLFNTANLIYDTWYSATISESLINKSGNSQFMLYSGNEGTTPTSSEYIMLSMAERTGSEPYLSIVTAADSGATIIYNISAGNDESEIMNVTYHEAENPLAELHEDWENGSFEENLWLTTGTPVMNTATPYEGSYSAGAIVSQSGTGTHTIKIIRSTSNHKWVNIDFANTVIDAGVGTPGLYVDWWDGTEWTPIVTTIGASAWGRDSVNLSGLGADNNPLFVLRFRMEFVPNQNSGNAIWIDDIYINSTKITLGSQWNTFIHPSEITDHNATHNLLRYDVYVDKKFDWINMTVNTNLVYSTHIPHVVIESGTGPSKDYYNITEGLNFLHELYTKIWFFSTKYNGTYNETNLIYPTTLYSYNTTHNIILYEFDSIASNFINLSINGTYVSLSPYADIVDYGNGIYNITNAHANTHYQFWILREKDQTTTTFHIAMWAEDAIGDLPMQGYWFESWKIYYSAGTSFNSSNATQISDSTFSLPYGTYTFGVLDWFGEVLAEQTAIANVQERFINIAVPSYEFAVNSLSVYDAEMFIYPSSNMSADPIELNVPAGKARYRYLRGSNYTIIASFIGTTQTVYFNRTVDSSLILRINGTTIEELTEIANNIYNWTQVITNNLTPGLIRNETNIPFKPAGGGTRSGGADDYAGVFLDPYQIMWGDVDQSSMNLTNAERTLWGGHLDTSVMAGDSITVLEDTLFISGTNTSASLMINASGTNIINTTISPAITYNIVSDYNAYKGANLTVYTNGSGLNIRRLIKFRWVGKFTWFLNENTNVMSTARVVNNTLDYTIWRPYVTIAFYPGYNISLDSIEIYDRENGVYLDPTLNYMVDATGISFEFNNLTSGESRTFSIVLSLEEGVAWNPETYGTPTIRMEDPQYFETEVADWEYRYFVTGTWLNTFPAPYEGDLVIIMDLPRLIDTSSVMVVNADGNEIADNFWYVNGQTIVITTHPQWSPGTNVQYSVYFLYASDVTEEDLLGERVFGIPWPWLLFSIGVVILGIGTAEEWIRKEDSKRTNVLQAVGAVIIAGSVVLMVFTLAQGLVRLGEVNQTAEMIQNGISMAISLK